MDYILKPFRNEEVVVRVETHLKINYLTRELAQKNGDLQAANREIQRATERKSRFLSSMVHELRTPMNAIMGFTRIVLRGQELEDRYRDNLCKVMQSGEHLLGLINDVLDISKIEAGRMELQQASCSFSSISL